MTLQTRPPIQILPESAPFSAEQRVWLDGFFAGLLGIDQGGVTALSPAESAAILSPVEDAPWHDPAMELGARMKLAEGRGGREKMFAAMAQQDCGQCGYVCETYSAALASKAETRLNLCAPGGKDTLRMLKLLARDLDEAPAAPAIIAAAPVAEGPSRDNPASTAFLARRRLNKVKSDKETFHIDIDLSGSGLAYEPGDSFGIVPRNDPRLADAVVALIGARPDGLVGGKMLRQVLIEDVALGAAPDTLFQLISYVTGGQTRLKAKRLAEGENPDGDLDRLDVLGALHKFSSVKIGPEAFVEALDRQQPRLYSISSSPLVAPGKLSLTVDKVGYKLGRRERHGVASTFLAERVQQGDPIGAYIQKAHGFSLPADPGNSIIMVGPGTGVAPFRSFVQHRAAMKAPGRNWLFFGHQHRETDFFYEEEFAAMQSAGTLNRLTLAWSRDSAEKIYVQDRMRQVGADLWSWLEGGAHFYVCGDAKRMARDVERAMVDVVGAHGKRSSDDAIAYVAMLKKAGRYQADVYRAPPPPAPTAASAAACWRRPTSAAGRRSRATLPIPRTSAASASRARRWAKPSGWKTACCIR